MAIIQAPTESGFEIGALAPAGTYVATCLEIDDQFGVDRPKFENPQETEQLDITRFLFGFRGQDGQIYKVQSFEFRISGSPKSNLIKFLTSWLGQAPQYGWDYCELKGQGAMITVAHKQSRDLTKTYANIVGISPVINQLKAQVLPVEMFGLPENSPPSQGGVVGEMPSGCSPDRGGSAPMATTTPQAPYNQTPQSSPPYQGGVTGSTGGGGSPTQSPTHSTPQPPQNGTWNPEIEQPPF